MLAGAYDLETSSCDVTVTGGSGSVKAHTAYGNITVSTGEASLDLHSSSGRSSLPAPGRWAALGLERLRRIRLTLPADTAVDSICRPTMARSSPSSP